ASKPPSFSDWIFSESGDLHYVRDAGITTLNAGGGAIANEFVHNKKQDSIDPYLDAQLGYSDSDKTEAHADFSLHRRTVANAAANTRIRSDDTLFGGRIQYLPTEKLGFRLIGSYADSNYISPGFSDTHGYTIAINAVDFYSPKLKLLAGLAGGENWADANPDVHLPGIRGADIRYTIGAEGEIAPKVTADTTIGVVQRQFRTGSHARTTTLYSDSRATWTETEKRSWSLEATQDFSVSAIDQSVRALGLFLSVNDLLAEKLTLQAAAGFERSNYLSLGGTGSRTDSGPAARARLTYQVNDATTLEIFSTYRDNASSSDNYSEAQLAHFSRFTFGAGLSSRF
ncbi:MAG TPA: outer membrane beta-barrel protein, partial [Opitutaceae bacterium]|nr:outer membrane beta-barrel protein [Opitutaceae bacterium]